MMLSIKLGDLSLFSGIHVTQEENQVSSEGPTTTTTACQPMYTHKPKINKNEKKRTLAREGFNKYLKVDVVSAVCEVKPAKKR